MADASALDSGMDEWKECVVIVEEEHEEECGSWVMFEGDHQDTRPQRVQRLKKYRKTQIFKIGNNSKLKSKSN